MDVAGFVLQFPEFSQVEVPIIQSRLNQAATLMGGPDASVWGPFAPSGQPSAFADTAQAYRAASLLIRSPFGGATALVSGGRDAYLEEFEKMEQAACSFPLVAGGSMALGFSPGFGLGFWP